MNQFLSPRGVGVLLGLWLAMSAVTPVRAGLFDKIFGGGKITTNKPAGGVTIDWAARRVSIPATALKQGKYLELKGAIEYILVSTGGKEYESLFTTKLTPKEVHQYLTQIGLRSGRPAGDGQLPKGQPVRLLVEYTVKGKTVRRPVEELVTLAKTNLPMSAGPWLFTGSLPAKDPSTGETILQANLTRSLVGLHPGDASPLLQNPRPESVRENTYAANLPEMPPTGSTVKFIFERVMAPIPPGTKRVQVEILGRVTGVGFRNFTQYQANQLGLKGGVRNAAENRVVATIEGPAEKVDQLLEKLKTGPRAAKVEKVNVKEVAPEGDYDEFEIQY